MKQLGAPSVFSFVFRREKLPVVRSKRDGSSRKITVYFHGNIHHGDTQSTNKRYLIYIGQSSLRFSLPSSE